ncbi:MAG: c-type cytochrome, partial [Bryobacteraceae bacterium]
MRSTFLRAVLIAVTAAWAQAQAGGEHSTTKLGNPFTSPVDRQAGAMFFRSQCASCHGQDGKGGAAGPDL